MSLKKSFINQSGQGLLELIIAIGVITSGLFAVWALFLSNFSGEEEARARIVGTNLAREGIEMVKNIRDSNWLEIEANNPDFSICGEDGDELCPWDDGLVGDGTAIVIDLNLRRGFNPIIKNNIILDFTPDNIDDVAAKLYLNSDGFFNTNSTGQLTFYRRLITLSDICCADSDNDLKCDDNNFEYIAPGAVCAVKPLKIGINVKSEVGWEVNSKPRSIVAEDDLFNWK